MGTRWRLSVMMFLQYAIWGAWAPVLGSYLNGFPGLKMGLIFSLLPLATIVAPFVFGQVADRWFATQKIMAALHLLAGISMLLMSRQTEFSGLFWCMAAFSLFYAPTLALSNSICFSHMENAEKEFGGIRVWGTIGWIAAGWILASVRGGFSDAPKAIAPVMEVVSTVLTPFAEAVQWVMGQTGAKADLLTLAGLAAVALGFFSLALPNTPPKKEATKPLAFMEALKLFANRNFTVFMVISFVVGTELEFYYMLTSPFLLNLGVSDSMIPWVMTIAQGAEIIVMAVLLPRLLPVLGPRKMLAIGAIAWPIRYAIFALLPIRELVIGSLALHGLCYVFFFVVGFIYVDTIAPKDIRASAQSLVALVVLGLGRYLGSILAGAIKQWFTDPQTQATNWQWVFLVPCSLTVACAVAFLLAFKEQKVAVAER